MQAARHRPVPRTHRTVPSGRASPVPGARSLPTGPWPPCAWLLRARPTGTSPPPLHFGTPRGPQGPAGIGRPVLPSDTLQTRKILALTPPLTSPCRRKRSSSRSPTAPSRRRRPTRPPSRRRPRRPSSVRWIHRYVNIVVPPLVSIDRINTKAFRHAGPPDRTKSTVPPAGKIEIGIRIFRHARIGEMLDEICVNDPYAQRE